MRHIVCNPRSPRMSEWISSITTNCRFEKSAGTAECFLRSSASSDSGVICSTPEGCSMSLRFLDCGTSPCQAQTGIPASAQRSVRRPNWSLMRAFKGAM